MVEQAEKTLIQVVLGGVDELPLPCRHALQNAAMALCDEFSKIQLDDQISPKVISAFNDYKSARAELKGEEEGVDAA